MNLKVGDRVTLVNRKVLISGQVVVDKTFFKDGKEERTVSAVDRLPNGIRICSFEGCSREYRLTEKEIEAAQ